jgi:hypothetical protein
MLSLTMTTGAMVDPVAVVPEGSPTPKPGSGSRPPPAGTSLWSRRSAAFHDLERAAAVAVILLTELHVAVVPEIDPLAATTAECRLERRRIRQPLKIVFVRPVVDVDLRLELMAADVALRPPTSVAGTMVVRAERVPLVVARAAVACVTEELVVLPVITDPLLAALGTSEALGLAAQAAPRSPLLGAGSAGIRLGRALSFPWSRQPDSLE